MNFAARVYHEHATASSFRCWLTGLFGTALVASALTVLAAPAHAQVPAPAAGGSKAAPGKPVGGVVATKSGWAELSPAQQSALQPLAPSWGSISEGQKRKWIALSRNFQALSPADRATLHGRMTEWVNLSPIQRSQARLNFAQTNQLPNDQKRAQWEAYQALSPEQKQQLAAGGQVLPGGAAPALKPVDPKKLAAVPVTRSEPASAARSPTPKLRALREAPATQRSAEAASAPAARP